VGQLGFILGHGPLACVAAFLHLHCIHTAQQAFTPNHSCWMPRLPAGTPQQGIRISPEFCFSHWSTQVRGWVVGWLAGWLAGCVAGCPHKRVLAYHSKVAVVGLSWQVACSQILIQRTTPHVHVCANCCLAHSPSCPALRFRLPHCFTAAVPECLWGSRGPPPGAGRLPHRCRQLPQLLGRCHRLCGHLPHRLAPGQQAGRAERAGQEC